MLKSGDRLVAVDGHRGDPARLSNLVNSHGCAGPQSEWKTGCRAVEPAKLTIVRNGERLTVTIRPKYDFPAGARGGCGSASPTSRAPPAAPARRGVLDAADRYWFITKQTLGLPARLINPEQRKQISGVVGSYEVTRQTILKQVDNVIGILAIISLSLAIVNLFPFLPLDGGHIFWAIVKKVRGRPVSLRVMERGGGGRLHAGDPDLPDRVVQRHRAPERRGLPGPLSPAASGRRRTTAMRGWAPSPRPP